MSKLCECRCGHPAPIATITDAKRGIKKGEPQRFIHGHAGRMQGDIRSRLLAKTSVNLDVATIIDRSPCWEWTGGTERGGYGQIKFCGRMAYVHRVAYEMWFGPIPGGLPGAKRGRGLDIDHLCRNRICVNPGHLEAVPHRVNIHRGDTVNAINAAKTECDSGHLFDEANTRNRRDGGRDCRACQRDRNGAAGVGQR